LWGKPAGFYFTYGKAKNGANNYFNTNPNDQKAWSVLGEVGFMPRWTAYAGYLRGDNGAATSNEDRRFSLGATWKLRQNVQMQLWNTHYSGNKYTPKPASGGDNIIEPACLRPQAEATFADVTRDRFAGSAGEG